MKNNILNIKAKEGIDLEVNEKEISIRNTKSNPNLIENWCFANPLNLRGQNYYFDIDQQISTIDGWYLDRGAALEVLDGYIRFTRNLSTTSPFFIILNYDNQYLIKKINVIPNKPYTFSFLYSCSQNIVAGVEYSSQYKYKSVPESENISLFSATYTFSSNSLEHMGFRISKSDSLPEDYNYYINIYAIKFEQGETQTLAYQNSNGEYILNDTPPNPQEVEISLYGDNGTNHYNYLTNWNWLNPINQFGKTRYEGASIRTIDRVITHANNNNVFRINKEGIWEIDSVDPEPYGTAWLGLRLKTTEMPFKTLGDGIVASTKTIPITVSALIKPYTCKYLTYRLNGLVNGTGEEYGINCIYKLDIWGDNTFRNSTQLYTMTYHLPINYWLREFQILINGNEESGSDIGIGIIAVKVEIGKRQTLARKNFKGEWELIDPLKSYQERLVVCQQYFQVVPLMENSSNEHFICNIIATSAEQGFGTYTYTVPLISNIYHSIILLQDKDQGFEGYLGGIFSSGEYYYNVPCHILHYKSDSERVMLRIVVATELTEERLVPGNSYWINLHNSIWYFQVNENLY